MGGGERAEGGGRRGAEGGGGRELRGWGRGADGEGRGELRGVGEGSLYAMLYCTQLQCIYVCMRYEQSCGTVVCTTTWCV